GIAPREDLFQRVGTGDEEQLVVGIFDPQITQRVHRVRLPTTVDVHATHREHRGGRGGHHGHEVTVLRRRHLTTRLLPWLAGGHEDHFIEPDTMLHLTGGNEVSVVNRVERAAHDPDTACGHGNSP